jgi:hypothetical protein
MKYRLHEIATGDPVSPQQVRDFPATPGQPNPVKGVEWVEYTAPVLPPPTAEQIAAQALSELTAALDRHIHRAAYVRGWDNIGSAAGRAAYQNEWQTQGTLLGQWRDACFRVALNVKAEVEAQTRAIPAADELIALMPEVPAEAGPVIREAGLF